MILPGHTYYVLPQAGLFAYIYIDATLDSAAYIFIGETYQLNDGASGQITKNVFTVNSSGVATYVNPTGLLTLPNTSTWQLIGDRELYTKHGGPGVANTVTLGI